MWIVIAGPSRRARNAAKPEDEAEDEQPGELDRSEVRHGEDGGDPDHARPPR